MRECIHQLVSGGANKSTARNTLSLNLMTTVTVKHCYTILEVCVQRSSLDCVNWLISALTRPVNARFGM
jgi:hypothetical protein